MGKLGWLLSAGMLSLSLGTSAWALDHDQKLAQMESDNAQILATLGKDKTPNQATSKKTDRTVQVKLLRAPKARKRG